ncbi:MAG: hypothetical protein L0H64_19120 [Pseudonocardia sp.]|nr:hypothetical protein [Pseudonocardia sp.]
MTAGRSTDRPLVRLGLVRLGLAAWMLLGVAAVLVLAWMPAVRLAVVTVPLLLALFPAALLAPVVGLLHRYRWPRPLATMFVVLVAFASRAGSAPHWPYWC